MENYKCPHCEAPLGNGVTVCGECGKELDAGQELTEQTPAPEARQNGKKIYAILAVFLVVVGGAALLLFTGMVPNPFKGGTTVAAIVNGEKIYQGDVDQKLDVYKKIYGQSTKTDFSSSEAKTALADMKRQVMNAMIRAPGNRHPPGGRLGKLEHVNLRIEDGDVGCGLAIDQQIAGLHPGHGFVEVDFNGV